MSYKIDALRKFAKHTGKQLCWSLFLINLQALPGTLFKNRLQHMCVLVKFATFVRMRFLQYPSDGCFWLNKLPINLISFFRIFLSTLFQTKFMNYENWCTFSSPLHFCLFFQKLPPKMLIDYKLDKIFPS